MLPKKEKQAYEVSGSVTYAHALCVEVEANSKEEARQYVYDNIDKFSNSDMSELVSCFIDDLDIGN